MRLRCAPIVVLALMSSISVYAQENSSVPQTIEVKGCVKKGVEAGCFLLKTSDGKTFVLHGKNLPTLDKKLVVSVKGKTGGVDHCMQGTPLAVSEWHWTRMRCKTDSQ